MASAEQINEGTTVRYTGTVPILRGKRGVILENRGHISLGSGEVYLVSFSDPALPIHGRTWNLSARHLEWAL